MRRLLDANIVIEIIGENLGVLRRMTRLAVAETQISSIAYAQVCLGIEQQPVDRISVRAKLAAIVGSVPVLPFDQTAALAYARVPFRRHRFDRLIAAHALALDAILVTRNARDFADVPGLRVEDWA